MTTLLFGGTGRLGTALRALRPLRSPPRAALDLRAADERALAGALVGARAVINAAALADVDACERDPGHADAINATFPRRLARVCAGAGVPLIQVSTDYVFGGGEGPWNEAAAPCPVQIYGASKARGEAAVLEQGGTVVRVSWLFGPGASPFARYVLAQARAGGPAAVFSGQRSRPTAIEGLAPWLLALADHLASGGAAPPILHPAGGPWASREDWARVLLDAHGYPDRAVVDQGPSRQAAPRPADSRLADEASDRWTRSAGLHLLPDWRAVIRGG